ncbi:DMT family transporter [Streptomyces fructofermentans]|uniref:DMT family transporter n=1 Tax=Streptomyces fructofermentans TaxID=152141 RepID=UPI0033DECF19
MPNSVPSVLAKSYRQNVIDAPSPEQPADAARLSASARPPDRAGSVLALVLLVAVTAVWGSTFLVIQDATRRMPVLDFVAARFTVGALVLAVLRPRAVVSLDAAGWVRGSVLGLVLGTSYTLQVLGLRSTSATVSAFVTGMFVVFTPLLSALVLRRRITLMTWAGTAIATAGLGLLTLKGFTVGPGELLTLGCAMCIAIQILGTDRWASGRDPYGLAFAQMVSVAATATLAALPGGLHLIPPDKASWYAVLWTAVFATAAALVVQTWAQTKLSAERVAVIMTMEPAFAAIIGLLAGQILSVKQAIGCALVLLAMLLVELHGRKARAFATTIATAPRDPERT